MSHATLNTCSKDPAFCSTSTAEKPVVNEQISCTPVSSSAPKPQAFCTASAYSRYHRPNYDVYNSDGVVIGRDT